MAGNGHLVMPDSQMCLVQMIRGLSMKFMRLLGWALIAMLYLILLGSICVRYPSNHGGGTVIYGWGLLFVTALNLFEMKSGKNISWLRILLMLSFGLILIACNQFNILVEYETWIARDMPSWGQFQHMLHF